MDIKDSYLHGTVGVVKSISVSADKLKYKLADIAGTVKEVTLPVATTSANGLMSSADKSKLDAFNSGSLKNNLVLKIDSGTTEGTSLYTYNGSAAKTLDIKSGTGIAFSKTAGALQIFNSGVRSIATGTTNGTISVNTNGTAADVAVKGLGSAAYTASTDYLNLKTYVSPQSDSWYYKKITVTKNTTDGYGIWLHSRQQHFLANSGLVWGTSYMLKLYELGTNINGTDTSRSMSVKMVAAYSSSDVTFYVKIQGYNYLQVVSSGTITILDSTQSEYDGITSSTEGWITCTYAKWTDTTYNVVSNSDNGLAPKVINTNTATIGSAYYVLASTNGSATPSWYKLPTNAFSNTTYTFANGTSGNFTVTPLGGTAQTVSIGKPATAGTADTAVKLQTKRKLWGQEFDGSADVSGTMTGVGNISMTGDLTILSGNTDKYITFDTEISEHTNSWRIGYLGTGSGNGNYFVLQSTQTTPNTWTSALTITNETLESTFAATVIAPTFKGNLDGTYVNKLTNYTKATALGAITATDSLNTALGKLEYKADTAYNLVKGAYDGDGTIENLAEILKVLEGIKDTETIQAIIGKYLPLTGGTLTGSLTIGDKNNLDFKFLQLSRLNRGIRINNTGEGAYITFGSLIDANGLTLEKILTLGDNNLRYSPDAVNYYDVLHAGNYKTYTVTKTGEGASGTWNINISGNAATASNASKLDDHVISLIGNKTGLPVLRRYAAAGLTATYIRLGTLTTPTVTSSGKSFVMFSVYGTNNFGDNGYGMWDVIASTRGAVSITTYRRFGNDTLRAGYVTTSAGIEIWVKFASTYATDTNIEFKNSTNFTESFLRQTTEPSGITYGPVSTSLTSGNYTDYINSTNFPGLAGVRSVTINNDYLKVNTNGTITNLTIPYAVSANKLNEQYVGDLDGAEANRIFTSGFQAANRPSHHNYATGISLYNSELKFKYLFAIDTYGTAYIRYKNTTDWQSWNLIAFISDIPTVPTVTDYYWANVKISSVSNNYTNPIFASLLLNSGDATLKMYLGKVRDGYSDGNFCLQTCIDGLDGETHTYATSNYAPRNNLILQPRGGLVYIGEIPDPGDTSYKLSVNGKVKAKGYTTSGIINSSLYTGSHIYGNQGGAIINSTAPRDGYVMLSSMPSTNGVFCLGVYKTAYVFYYTAQTTIDAGTNACTKSLTLLDESGNSYFPGDITAVNLKKSGSSDNYVLLGGGGHKTLSSITAASLNSTTVISAKAFSLSNDSWTNTGYTFANLTSGTYAIQVTCGHLVASGIMSVYKNINDTAGDEIPLHVYHDSTQPWRPYLRTYNNKLLISSNDASATSRTVTIKIALIL